MTYQNEGKQYIGLEFIQETSKQWLMTLITHWNDIIEEGKKEKK